MTAPNGGDFDALDQALAASGLAYSWSIDLGPTDIEITTTDGLLLLAALGFNRDDGGWEAVIDTNGDQTPLLDGPAADADPAEVVTWLAAQVDPRTRTESGVVTAQMLGERMIKILEEWSSKAEIDLDQAASFSDLHQQCDANMILIDAREALGLPALPEDMNAPDAFEFDNTACDVVTAWLAARNQELYPDNTTGGKRMTSMAKYKVTYEVTVDALGPEEALALGVAGGKWDVVPVIPPALTLIPHEAGEDGTWHEVQCPHCDATTTEITEVDSAVRHNVADLEIDGDEFSLAYGTGQTDFEHDGYICGACGKPVSLPDGYDDPDESWN